MRNGSHFSPSFENQYLESDHFDQEGGDFEDLEMLYEDLEDGEYEDQEMTYEDHEVWENDHEGDQFFGSVFKIAKPFLRKVVPHLASTVGGRIAGRRGAGIARMIASHALREADMEGDHELDHEGDPEGELEAMGVDPELLAEMAHYTQMAMETDNEQEADHFIGAIANLAGQILPSLLGESDHESNYEYEAEDEADHFLPLLALAAKPLLGKVVGKVGGKLLGKGVRALGGLLRRSRGNKKLLAGMNRITTRAIRSTAGAIRNAQLTRRPITAPALANVVNRSMARSIATTLATPARIETAFVRNRALARRYRVSGTIKLHPLRRRRPIRR